MCVCVEDKNVIYVAVYDKNLLLKTHVLSSLRLSPSFEVKWHLFTDASQTHHVMFVEREKRRKRLFHICNFEGNGTRSFFLLKTQKEL